MGSAPHRTEIPGDKVTISSSALSGGSKRLSPGCNQGQGCPEPLDKNHDGVQG